MANELIVGDRVWKRLTAAAKKARTPVLAAVAYFGKGAHPRLPLPEGSQLVVDASKRTVAAGQTHPDDLLKLCNRGVSIYDVGNLHAKVYAFRRHAFIGSANVSNNSATELEEAVLMTTDPRAVLAVKSFVRSFCHHELGPEALKALQKYYRPPKTGQGARTPQMTKQKGVSAASGLRIVRLVEKDPPSGSEKAAEKGQRAAKKKLLKPKRHQVYEFFWTGKCPYVLGEYLMCILATGDGAQLVSPPGRLINLEVWKGPPRTTFIFLEQLRRRRVRLERLAKMLGYGAKARLTKGRGRYDSKFIEGLWDYWNNREAI
jgi:hypothetical protein